MDSKLKAQILTAFSLQSITLTSVSPSLLSPLPTNLTPLSPGVLALVRHDLLSGIDLFHQTLTKDIIILMAGLNQGPGDPESLPVIPRLDRGIQKPLA
jgi:hypothetical protein